MSESMEMSRKLRSAFILIDYTVDFVHEDGKLTVGKPGQTIKTMIEKKIQTYVAANDLVMVVNDLHELEDKNHPEHKLFPPHNIFGTPGRKLYGNLEELLITLEKDNPGQIFRLDKRRYSAFYGTPLELILRQEGITSIELAGVCTDICILHSAVDAYNKGFNVTIDEGAVASFNSTGHELALDHFESVMGFRVLRRG